MMKFLTLAAFAAVASADLSDYDIQTGYFEVDAVEVMISEVQTEIIDLDETPIEVSWATSQALDSTDQTLWMSITMMDVYQKTSTNKNSWSVSVGASIGDEIQCTWSWVKDNKFTATAEDLWQGEEDSSNDVTLIDNFTIDNGSHSTTASCLVSRLLTTGDASEDQSMVGVSNLGVTYTSFKSGNVLETESGSLNGNVIELDFTTYQPLTPISGAEFLALSAVTIATVAMTL